MCMHTDSQYDHAPSHHALMRLRPENSVFFCFEKRQNKLVVRNSFEEIKLANGEVTISKKWGNSKNFIEVAFSILSKPVAACIHRLLIACFQPLRKEVHEKVCTMYYQSCKKSLTFLQTWISRSQFPHFKVL